MEHVALKAMGFLPQPAVQLHRAPARPDGSMSETNKAVDQQRTTAAGGRADEHLVVSGFDLATHFGLANE